MLRLELADSNILFKLSHIYILFFVTFCSLKKCCSKKKISEGVRIQEKSGCKRLFPDCLPNPDVFPRRFYKLAISFQISDSPSKQFRKENEQQLQWGFAQSFTSERKQFPTKATSPTCRVIHCIKLCWRVTVKKRFKLIFVAWLQAA